MLRIAHHSIEASSRTRPVISVLIVLIMITSAMPTTLLLSATSGQAASGGGPAGDGVPGAGGEDRSRGVLPSTESFDDTRYRALDTDNNSKRDAIEVRYTVRTTAIQEQVTVLIKALDGDGNTVKFHYDNFTAFLFGNQQRNWTFYAYYTGFYRLSLTLYDSQDRKEDTDVSGVYSLDTGTVKRWITVKTKSLDLDKDSFDDDVEVHVTNWTSKDVSGAQVWVNGSYVGKTNSSGKILAKNYPKGWINIDAFSGNLHNSTSWYSEGDGTVIKGFSVRAEPFDSDGDGLEDDVEITVRNALGLPVFNAQVTINASSRGTTNLQGQLTVYNIRTGWWTVNATKLNNFGSTRFYSEGQGPGTDLDEFFYDWDFKVLDLDRDDRMNDLRFRFDVDVDPPALSNVTVWVNMTWVSNGTAAYNGSTSYITNGTKVDWHNVTFRNVTYGNYWVWLELLDSDNNTEDWEWSRVLVVRPSNHVNIETGVFWDSFDYSMDDLLFRALRVNEGEPNVTVALFNDTGVRVRRGKTSTEGRLWFSDLPDATYNFTAKDKSGRLIEKGRVVISARVQVETDLTDLDGDGFFDDFNVRAYNNADRAVNTVTVAVWAPNGTEVTSNRTVGGNLRTMNLSKGTYEFNATYLGNELVNGTFYSYGNVLENFTVVVLPRPLDLDGDDRYDDVNVTVVDTDDSPLEFAKVYVDGVYKTLTDLGGNTIIKDLSWGIHTIEAHYSGEVANAIFFSEGTSAHTASWTMLVIDKDERRLPALEAVGSTNDTVLLYYAESTTTRPRASHMWLVLEGGSQEINLSRINGSMLEGSTYRLSRVGILGSLLKYAFGNYSATRTSLNFLTWPVYEGGKPDYSHYRELASAMKGIGKKADLLMHSNLLTFTSYAYELRDVSSLALSRSPKSPPFGDMAKLITGTPTATGRQLGELAVDKVTGADRRYMFLMDLTKVGVLVAALDDLAEGLVVAYPGEGWPVQDARNATDHPAYNHEPAAYAAGLASELESRLSARALIRMAGDVKTAVDAMVLKRARSTAGLAIVFPNTTTSWESLYWGSFINDSKLSDDSDWDEFLDEFWRFRNYGIHVNATAFDADSSGRDNDVKVYVNDTYGKAIAGARVHINLVYAGTTNSTGWIEAYNYTRGTHLVNVTWGEHEDETTFYSEGTITPNKAPVVTIDRPTEDETVNRTYTVEGTASDPDGIVSRVEVRFNGSAWRRASGRNNWDYDWNTRLYSDGTWLIEARAYDGDLWSPIVKVNVTVLNPVEFAEILLVDDDGGEGYDAYYTQALVAGGYSYDIIHVARGEDGPGEDRLSRAKYVIWMTGEESVGTLTTSDVAALASFLDAGGGLWLTGQDIGRDITDDGAVTSGFMRDYLRADYVRDNADDYGLIGVVGENISGGINISIEGGTGARNQNYPSEISPRGGATAVYLYNATAEAAVKYGGSTFRTVYFAFGFEGIAFARDRNRVLDAVLDWLASSDPTLPNRPPVANAGNAVTTIAGEPARFRGTATDPDGLVALFEWDFDGDGTYDWSNASTGETTWVFDTEGDYTAKFRATDNVGDFATDTVEVEVRPRPPNQPPVADAGDDIEVDQGTFVSFMMVGTDPDGLIVLFEWDYDGDGEWDENSTVAKATTLQYITPGVFNATLRVTDDEGATGSDVRVVTVIKLVQNQPPVADAGPDRNATVGEEIMLVGTGSDPDGYIRTYKWDFDGDGVYDDTNLTTGTMTWVYTTAGVYEATLLVIDDDDASNWSKTTVTVTPIHVNEPPVADAGPSTILEVDQGEDVTFPANGSDPDGVIVLFEWDYDGDGEYDWNSSQARISIWVFDRSGLFIARLRVTDNEGATDTDTLRVSVRTVHIPNDPPVADAGGPYTGVAGEPVTLIGTGTDDDGTIVLYEWDFKDDGHNDWYNPDTGVTQKTYSSPGTYTAVLTVTDDGDLTAKATAMVTIYPANEPPTVRITSPVSGHTVRGLVVFRGEASDDDGVEKVMVKVDDEAWVLARGTTSWTYDLNTAQLSPGSHSFKARATDTDGNATIAAIEFNVEPEKEKKEETTPGFGAVAALLAVIASLGVASALRGRRRR